MTKFINIYDGALTSKEEIKFFDATLIPAGGERLDPFILATNLLAQNIDINPIIAINPLFQHPYDVLKKIISLQKLYQKRVGLNLVSGSFPKELLALGDQLDSRARDQRLESFYQFLVNYLEGDKLKAKNIFYEFDKVHLIKNNQKIELDFYVSSNLDLVSNQHATHFAKVLRPEHFRVHREEKRKEGLALGISIVKNDESYEEHINKRFPYDRQNETLSHLKLLDQSSNWNCWIKDHLENNDINDPCYNLRAYVFNNSSVPYLCGNKQFILDQFQTLTRKKNNFFIIDYFSEDFESIKDIITILRK